MVQSTKELGQTTKQMAKEGSFMLMKMCMMANGRMTKQMVMGSIGIRTAYVTKDNGRKTNNTVKA